MRCVRPHAPPLREVRCPPRGPLPPWGGPAAEGVCPHAPPLREVRCPPRGPLPPWGGPAAEGVCPHAPPLAVSLPRPPGGEGRGEGARQRGFSLLEILVAFAIAAMALGLLYQVSGNNARQAGGLLQHERAMVLAQSLLAAHETVPARGLDERGEGAGYGWYVHSRPYPTPAGNAAPQAARLHELRIDVRWHDGTAERSFELSSLRPERRPQPGEVIR